MALNARHFGVFLFPLMLLWSGSARGDLVVSGEGTLFTGAGSYTLSVFATATGGAEEIGGYNITLDFSDPGLTFQSLVYNGAFESTLPVLAGSDPALLQATDTNFVGLNIPNGGTESLVEVTFNATGTGEIPISVQQMNTVFFAPITTSVSPTAGALSVTAIPEPSSCLLIFTALSIASLTRREKRPSTEGHTSKMDR